MSVDMSSPAVEQRAEKRAGKRRRGLVVAVGVVLVTSLVANAALLYASLEFYRREQLVRLFPARVAPSAKARREGRTQVLFLGDSRMEAWPDLPADRFVTVNAGVGGETTAQIRVRAAATLDAVRPELVVLQAGMNDLKTIGALPELARETEANCLGNLRALVELCRERGARVVLVPIYPAARPSFVRRLVWSSEIDAARRRVNAALRERFLGAAGIALLDDSLVNPNVEGDYQDTLHFRPAAYLKLQAAALEAFAAF